ncbi:fumarylacetoacetate hydrolase family protein [Pedobacter sp. SD-b]|uniref:Fumarylacetoacetate hydrolase family protein n=1 Tax=Pedobacter segetis TaxID=2793069 RepID=A0ABS1BL03_9SPHI|nr:fumarylacetoacetate hydrolase family protein [Pedobacter segetis]MBK0383483.1 fumarylacetoacetate hydrolase family protein [Pedobacter segetis]
MKIVSYKTEGLEHLGVFFEGHIYNLNSLNPIIPNNMAAFLSGGEPLVEAVHRAFEGLKNNSSQIKEEIFYELIAPVPHPTSLRDAYAFRQHVATARRNRGAEMLPEFDQFPVFYFGNHHAINGPGEILCMPDHFQKLDFELEIAIVINKKGRNIKAAEADDYIAGYMIMNDFSARTLQLEEMKLNLGPAKGKDFATSIGPWLVTKDELEAFKIKTKTGHTGNCYQLDMQCWVNDEMVSRGNFETMDWTFAEIIERISYGCDILPGDVIGSGTVGTGCFLELNGTAKLENPTAKEQWLQPNDKVELRIQGLGVLSNIITAQTTDFSILALKK